MKCIPSVCTFVYCLAFAFSCISQEVNDWENPAVNSRHRNGERRRRAPLVGQGATILNIDVRQTGLGGASCGPGPMDAYRFDSTKEVEWTLMVKPLSADKGR